MRSIYILFSAIVLFGCNKFLDVNENPNRPGSSTLPLRAKFSAALLSTAIKEATQINQIGGLWGGYWGTPNEAMNQFADLKQYNGLAIRHQRDGIKVWEDAYANLNYLELIKQEAIADNDLFYVGTTKIIQGWLFLRLVDFYNDVPFSEALQGTSKLNPAYDNGKTVYEQSIKMITEGIQDIKDAPNSSTIDPGASDIIFGGNKTLWIRFANTIKLRALLRQSEVADAGYIQSEINIIQSEGTGFLGAGEHASANPGFTASNGNPFYISYYRDQAGASTANRENIRPTEFLLETLEDLNDPRLPLLFTRVAGEYNGVKMGNPVTAPEYARDNTSAFVGPAENGNQPAGIFKSITQGIILIGDFESAFLQAEAIERGWLSGDAADMYKQGIQRSFQYIGVDVSLTDAYVLQTNVSLTSASDRIARIIEQKWIALYGNSNIEAWNDFRRLGVPAIPNSLEAPTPTARPLRLMYPETERMTNNEQALKAGNDDILTARVWWDL